MTTPPIRTITPTPVPIPPDTRPEPPTERPDVWLVTYWEWYDKPAAQCKSDGWWVMEHCSRVSENSAKQYAAYMNVKHEVCDVRIVHVKGSDL